jgi:hypothetical protein
MPKDWIKMEMSMIRKERKGIGMIVIVGARIKGPITPSISPEFYSRNGRGGSSNLLSEPRSWV